MGFASLIFKKKGYHVKITKVKDILRFPFSGYCADVSLDHVNRHVQDHIETLNLDLDPIFQRGHVWSRKQQTAFIEYLLAGGTSGRDLYFNHPGWMTSFKGNYVIVDGK